MRDANTSTLLREKSATNTLGYGETEVTQAVAEQAKQLHARRHLYPTEQQLEFAEKIAEISPAGMRSRS